MKLINPLQMIDWPIKKFLIIIFACQLLFLGSISLDFIGLKIPMIRPLICIIYLSFIPGILILRILKLHRLGSIKNLLYSTGLSLSLLMFMGFFMNMCYPAIGIKNPISTIMLTISVSFLVLLLSALCYLFDRNFSDFDSIFQNVVFSIPSLFLCLIPLLTIIGVYIMNLYNNNSLLLTVILLISSVIVLVILDFIPKNLYPLAIFVTSISLLFHSSLISMYITGWDIQFEYYEASKVINNSIWNPGIFSNINAMLSIVMIAPIYSILSNLSITWVFKIIYPAIFSLVPVGLYLIFKKQTDYKIAFMSVFFFMSVFTYYTEML